MTEKEYIIHHIRKNHEKKTIKELAITLDIKEDRVRDLCKSLNISPITEKQKKANFIIENAGKMSAPQMARKLGVSDMTIRTLMKENGIDLAKINEQRRKAVKSIISDITKYEGEDNEDGEELIQLAKKVLAKPQDYHEVQVLVAMNVRKTNPQKFQTTTI